MLGAQGQDPFEERLNIVLHELLLGIQWERPCLILAIYRSEITKNMIQGSLTRSLQRTGQSVIQYTVDGLHYDIPLHLLHHPKHERTVFFVNGLHWGGGRGYSNAYRALNLHREYLIEGNIRSIFWLTPDELKQLARFSPDFWAFRHEVVEFLDLPSIKGDRTVRASAHQHQDLYASTAEEFRKWINIAEAFSAQGCMADAILNYRKALRRHPDETPVYLEIARIYLELRRVNAARRALHKAAKNKKGQVSFLTELDRLGRLANSLDNITGGFSELPA